jgi:hypothetical protein
LFAEGRAREGSGGVMPILAATITTTPTIANNKATPIDMQRIATLRKLESAIH